MNERRYRVGRSESISVLGAIMLLLAISSSAQSAELGDAGRGKKLFYDHGCFGCHGFNGNTGVRNLVGTSSPILQSSAAFTAYLRLREDLRPVLPSESMPSYSENALSNANAADIYAHIRTFVLDAPDPKTIAAFAKILESAKGSFQSRP